LIAAAVLKSIALIANIDKSHGTLALPVWLIYTIVTVELLSGAWILLNDLTQRTWVLAFSVFLVFSVVSLYQAFSGAEVCGCFGILSVSPWLVFSLDIASLSSLCVCGKRPLATGAWRRGAAVATLSITICLSLTVLVRGVTAYAESASSREDDHPSQLPVAEVHRQIEPNIHILLSSAGLCWQSNIKLTGDLPDEHDLGGYLRAIASRLTPSPQIVSVPVQSLQKAAEQRLFEYPLIARTSIGKVLVLLEVLKKGGDLQYLLVDGSLHPRLESKLTLDEAIVELWQVAPAAEATGVPGDSGIVTPVGRSRLRIDRLFHSFGLVTPYQNVKTAFTFSNTGPGTITLTVASISCTCTHARFPSDQIFLAPGESTVLSVVVDTALESIRQQVTVAAFDADDMDGTLHNITLELLGCQPEILSVSPRTVDFGRIDDQKARARTIQLYAGLDSDVRVVDIDVGGLPMTWAQKPDVLTTEDRRIRGVELKLHPEGLATGEQTRTIRIKTNSKRIPEVTIRCKFDVPSKITLSPQTISFGAVKLGSQSERVVVVKCQGATTCTIKQKAESSAQMLKVKSIALVGSNEYRVTVSFSAGTLGPVHDAIVFEALGEHFSETFSLTCAAYVKAG
jgi:hypothetical protein